jgi:hypothetical protein
VQGHSTNAGTLAHKLGRSVATKMRRTTEIDEEYQECLSRLYERNVVR